VSGVISLTLVLSVFFLIEGVASIMFALDHRRERSGQWAWMLASGIIDLILAAIIFTGLPGTAIWALGFLVGHQPGVRRLGADRDGSACPFPRSAHRRPCEVSDRVSNHAHLLAGAAEQMRTSVQKTHSH
jgi:hypothetical protein